MTRDRLTLTAKTGRGKKKWTAHRREGVSWPKLNRRRKYGA